MRADEPKATRHEDAGAVVRIEGWQRHGSILWARRQRPAVQVVQAQRPRVVRLAPERLESVPRAQPAGARQAAAAQAQEELLQQTPRRGDLGGDDEYALPGESAHGVVPLRVGELGVHAVE